MRGGRGGRGRGGFGRGGSSFIQSFLRDSGDYRNVNDPEDAPPPLYPPITLPAPVELNEEDKFLLQMNSEIIKRYFLSYTFCIYISNHTIYYYVVFNIRRIS